MARIIALLLAALILCPDLSAQTPEQRYLDWHQPDHPAEVYQGRRARLMDALGAGVMLVPSHHGVSDGYSFRQLDDFWYLTGLELPGSMLVLDGDRHHAMVFVPAEDARFASPSRPNDFPGRPLVADAELWQVAGLTDVNPIGELDSFLEGLERVLVNAGRGGSATRPETSYFLDWTPEQGLIDHLAGALPRLEVANAFDAMARVRMIKGPEELETIRRVVELTAEAIAHAASFVEAGVSERDLEAELEASYKRSGAQRLAFSSIIKSGPNSLWPWRILAAHYNRRNRQMEDGDLVIFDVGTELDGYVSDVGRTFPVSGSFSDRQREILSMEVAVADAIINNVRPGRTLSDLMQFAHAAIPPEHKPYMQTGVFFGHFIGMSTGDPALYDIPLAPGMVFTVEPWYYNHDEGISVFTEDVVAVTEDGVEVLSGGLPRTAEALERMVGGAVR